MNKKLKLIGILSVSVLLIGILVFNYVFHGGARNLATEKAAYTVTSKSIINEFTSNIPLTTQKYSNKAIVISGLATSVSDSIVIIDDLIICNFTTPINNIKKQQTISIKGRLVGFDELMGELKLDECSINLNN